MLVFFIVLAVFIVIAFVLVKFLTKKLNEQADLAEGAPMKDDRVQTAQQFLQFDSIKDNVINLGKDRYRMVVEVSSTNYHLKTEGEKNNIELSFQSFINSLTFPVTIYYQTKIIDDSKLLMQLEDDINEATEMFPSLKDYGNIYYSEMTKLYEYIGNNKIKKKYIIIPFEEVNELTEFNEKEKYEEAIKRINERASFIVEALGPVDLKGKILNNNELIELVYSAYNRNDIANAEHLVSGEYLVPIVEGENKLNSLTNAERAEFILYEAQTALKQQIIDVSQSQEEKEAYGYFLEHLGKMRLEMLELEEDNQDNNINN